MVGSRLCRRLLVVTLLASWAHGAAAQGDVTVDLQVDPYPSPHLADWESRVGVFSLNVTNGPRAQDLVMLLTVRAPGGRAIVTARSDPQPFAAGEMATYSAASDLGGSFDYDTSFGETLMRTGTLPEGEYELCVRVEDAAGTEVAPEVCVPFTIELPDPPYLLAPTDGENVATDTPVFQWTPVALSAGRTVRYRLQIAEILPTQTPYEALTANVLLYDEPDITVESLAYPLDGTPFDAGATYAWWVVALDDDGNPLTANLGRSEIWTFTRSHDDTGLFASGDPQSLRVAAAGQATGPLANFDNLTFDEATTQLQALAAAGSAIELPIDVDGDFATVEIGGVTIYVDRNQKSLAIRGTREVRGRSYDVMFTAYWGSRHDPRNKALSVKGPQFEGFFPREGLLDGLSTTTAWFVISGGEFKLASSELPPGVADYFGDVEIGVKRGLNLFEKVQVKKSSWLADVATALAIPDSVIDLQGTLGAQAGAVFGTAEPLKIQRSQEVGLSAGIGLWHPRGRAGDIFTALEGKLQIGGAREVTRTAGADSAETDYKATAQLGLEATIKLPFLAARADTDGIKFTGAVKVEKEVGKPTAFEISLGADDLVSIPAFKNVISMHDLTYTATFERGDAHTRKHTFSAKCDVGRYTDFGELKIIRATADSASAAPDTSAGEEPPPGGVPTPFKQAELLAKEQERAEAARRKPRPGRQGKWSATISVDQSALKAIKPRELLKDLMNFGGNLAEIWNAPDLSSLSLGFLPDVPGSMVVTGATMLQGSPTYFLGSRVKSADGQSGVLFALAPQHWSFREHFPDADIPLLSDLDISNVGLLVSTTEFTASSADIYGQEYGFYRSLYERDDFTVTVKPGLNIVASLPVEGMGPDSPLIPLMDRLGVERGPALLQGAVGTKIKDLYFRAALPPMHPPGAPGWFRSGQLDLEITGQPSLGLVGSITVVLDDDDVTFFVKTKAGRDGLTLTGGMDSDQGWRGPFGIEWMTIDRAVLLLGLTPAGSVQLGFEGDLEVGEKDVRIAALTALNAATGVPTNLMVDGASEAGVSVPDLLALQARIAAAHGRGTGQPIPADKLPLLGVSELKLKFAPKDSPELEISRGLAIGGTLTMAPATDQPPATIAATDFDLGDDGLIARAKVGDFVLGPVSLSDAALDLTATRQEQYFRLSGKADLKIMQAAVDVDCSRTHLSFDAEGKAFGLFMADLHALGSADLKNPAFKVNGTLRNDFNAAAAAGLIAAAKEAADGEVAAAERLRDRTAADHAAAVDARNRARAAWAHTPLLPRSRKAAARRRWGSASRYALLCLARRAVALSRYEKWVAVQAALAAAEGAAGEGSPIRIRSATFDGDLARMKDGQVAKLAVVAEIQGTEVNLQSSGFNFRDMGPGLKDLAGQAVQRMFQARE